ncbi:MAG: NUDIX domain-containing protein [Patescibacteria group bacterium]
MKAPRNAATTASYLFLRKGDQILLARRRNTGYQDGNYAVPAGHLDAGEMPTEALVREVKEEIGIDINPVDAKLVHTSFRPKHDETGDRVDYYFEVRKWGGEVENLELGKCDDIRWINIDDLPENMTPHVRVAIEMAEAGQVLSELNLDYLRANGYVVEE